MKIEEGIIDLSNKPIYIIDNKHPDLKYKVLYTNKNGDYIIHHRIEKDEQDEQVIFNKNFYSLSDKNGYIEIPFGSYWETLDEKRIVIKVLETPFSNLFIYFKKDREGKSIGRINREVFLTLFRPSNFIKINQQQQEEQMNNTTLKLLAALMSALQDNETVKDATNSNFVGIMTNSNNEYIGYLYADTEEELSKITAKPENEGNLVHVFNYSKTLTQKPRKVTTVPRN